MTMSSYRVEPREVRVERFKRIYGYLMKHKCASIRILTQEPDVFHMPKKVCDWEEPARGKVSEVLPTDSPEPLRKYVVTMSYHDANFHHNVTTGRSVTGVLHLVKKLQLTGFIRNNLHSKRLHMVLNVL